MKKIVLLLLGVAQSFTVSAQQNTSEAQLASIRKEGLANSKAYEMLSELTDVYGQRLTGSREYLEAAKWMSSKMKNLGLQEVHFENYCDNCRGWSIKSFNVEMVAPNYMQILAYPLAMAESTPGAVEGEIIHINSIYDYETVKKEYAGKLKGKIILAGKVPKKKRLTDTILDRYTAIELDKMEKQLTAQEEVTPLPDLIKSWETSDRWDQQFLEFAKEEGALAIFAARRGQSEVPGLLHTDGTYYYLENDIRPLPYFAIAPEHFGRIVRAMKYEAKPRLKLNLETEFYLEPENNVNIIAELKGSDPKLKSEVILIGGHFDSWHPSSGATDNAASAVVMVEAMRILKATGLSPKRTIRIGLWGGEEQAFLGSVAYARQHFGTLTEKPNSNSKKVSVYLNLDNGAGAIRGIYLQDNELARPVFEEVFDAIPLLTEGALTIENTLSTDHETFDHYNIPAFQFIQDKLTYSTVTHHTNMDFIEFVPEEDLMKNAVIMAWTIYSLGQMDNPVPRKSK
ncbi:M20/M25/M40 family metallo-hydrolase [Maribacter sp.]|nr:M20/M25/M40 family metallo-hydrolase [Maribacter sp.]